MEMKSMKIDSSAEDRMRETMMSDPSDYPYALCLRLEEDTIEALGVGDPPPVGTEVTIQAKAIVRSTSVMDQEGKKYRSMEIQITDMGLDVGKQKDIQKVLYGE